MPKKSKKSKSKRQTLKQKYKVIKKVKEHHKKKAKELRKQVRLLLKPARGSVLDKQSLSFPAAVACTATGVLAAGQGWQEAQAGQGPGDSSAVALQGGAGEGAGVAETEHPLQRAPEEGRAARGTSTLPGLLGAHDCEFLTQAAVSPSACLAALVWLSVCSLWVVQSCTDSAPVCARKRWRLRRWQMATRRWRWPTPPRR